MVAASIFNHHDQPDNPVCRWRGVEQLRTHAGADSCRCGLMQLRTLQTIDDSGPTASKTVLLAIPIEIMELLQRAAKSV